MRYLFLVQQRCKEVNRTQLHFLFVTVSREKNETHKKRICNNHDITLQRITSRFQSFYDELSDMLFSFSSFSETSWLSKTTSSPATQHIPPAAFSNNDKMGEFFEPMLNHKNDNIILMSKRIHFKRKKITSTHAFELNFLLTFAFDQTDCSMYCVDNCTKIESTVHPMLWDAMCSN